MKGTSCTPQITPPAVPTTCMLFPNTKSKNITVTGSNIHPQTYHIFPQYLLANDQVSLFFTDMAVRYPKSAFGSFGLFFIKYLPKPIIVSGMIKSISSINIQNPIKTSFCLSCVLLTEYHNPGRISIKFPFSFH